MTKLHPHLPLAVAGALLLAGCAGQAVKPGLPAGARVCDAHDTDAGCQTRIAAINAGMAAQLAGAAAGDPGATWTMQGRAVISTGKQSGNARIEWQQQALDGYNVTLSAPVTRQSWQLEVDGATATLRGLEGGPRTGPDAALLLREATGWDIPVASMAWWLRGWPARGSAPSRYVFSSAGALIGVEQDGWRIDFTRAAADALPTRINAERGESRVRLVIDQWGDAAGG